MLWASPSGVRPASKSSTDFRSAVWTSINAENPCSVRGCSATSPPAKVLADRCSGEDPSVKRVTLCWPGMKTSMTLSTRVVIVTVSTGASLTWFMSACSRSACA